MPQRIAASDVQAIRPTTQDPQPFITAASLMVDAYDVGAEWPLALATEIERWLTAHLMAVAAGPGLASRKIGDTTISYQKTETGTGLEATPYGQQVLLLDSTGTIAAGMSTKAATFEVF